jgi:rhamnosyl/mannosyltransferase
MPNFIQDLARAQAASGHSVRVLTHRLRSKSRTTTENDRGVEVVRAGVAGLVRREPVSHAFFSRLKALVRDFQPDVVHAHLPNWSAFWVLRLNVPLVVHWHADVPSPENAPYLNLAMSAHRSLERRMLERARTVVATSQTYLEASETLAPYKDKCVAIPLGLDEERLRAGQKPSPPLNQDKSLIMAVGRFAQHKGFAHLIKAAASVPRADVVIAGSGPLLEEMRQRVRDRGLSERIRLPGRVHAAELYRFFEMCDVFCLPSVDRREAFGLPILEAHSLGKAVACSDIPGSGVQELCRHKETAFMVPPGDADDLALSLRQLLADAGLRRHLGQNGKRRFEEHYRIETVAGRIEEVYAGVR